MGYYEVASLVISVASAVSSEKRQKKSAAFEREAQEKQTALEKTRLSESRRQQIREARRRRAQILQRAETLGVSGSSGEAGAVGAVTTTTGYNIGAQRGETAVAESIGRSRQSARDVIADATTFAAVSDLSMDIFRSTGGFENLLQPNKTKE